MRVRITQPPAVRPAPEAGLVVRSGGRAYLSPPRGRRRRSARHAALRAARGARRARRQRGQPAGRPGPGHPRRRAGGAPGVGCTCSAGGALGARSSGCVGPARHRRTPAGRASPGRPGRRRADRPAGGSLLLTRRPPGPPRPVRVRRYRGTADPLGRPLGPRRLRGGPARPGRVPCRRLPRCRGPGRWRLPGRRPRRSSASRARLRTASGEDPVVTVPPTRRWSPPRPGCRPRPAAGLGGGRSGRPGADPPVPAAGAGSCRGRRGTAYPVAGDEARDRLGYADDPAPEVPAGGRRCSSAASSWWRGRWRARPP